MSELLQIAAWLAGYLTLLGAWLVLLRGGRQADEAALGG